MTAFPFVDAHVHFWDLSRIRYPWLTPPFDAAGPNGSVETIARDYLPDDYRTDVAGADLRGAIHVDAGAEAAAALDETRWLEEVADASGLPTGIVAFAALDDPDVEALLERQAANPRVRGIRHIVNWHTDPVRTYASADVTTGEKWRRGFALLGRYGLSFDLQCYPGQMPGLAELIARHEEVPVVVNHLGMPVLTDEDGLAQWRLGMRALAANPHVAVKLSGLGFVERGWTYETVLPLLRETVDTFTPARCMFASDAPTDKLFAPIRRYLDAYADFGSFYSEDEQRDMWGRNANRVYRLGLEL